MLKGLKSIRPLLALLVIVSTAQAQESSGGSSAPGSNEHGTAQDPAQTPADTAEPKGKEQKEVQQAGETAKGVINTLGEKGLIDQNLATELANIINGLVKSTRADQASIYTFVRTVNRNLDMLAETCQVECAEFIGHIRETNRKLLRSSYTDGLFQNKNLSHQIQVRLPLLIADSATLAGNRPASQGSNNTQQTQAPPSALSPAELESLSADFSAELDLLADRYLSSRRFRAGLGFSYSYLPTIRYQDIQRVDFSPFQTEASGGSDSVIFNTEFDNRSLSALTISAKVPYVQLDLSFPNAKHTETITTTVQQRPGDADNDILARTTVEAELAVEYEASLKVSFVDILEGIKGYRCRKETIRTAGAVPAPRPSSCGPGNYQYDYGIGVGMTGLRVKNSGTTDVRFRTDPGQTFNDLPPGATIDTQTSSTFNTLFVALHGTFRISDEFQVGLEARQYRKNGSSEREIDVEDTTLTFSVVWYPTFEWL